MNPAEGAATTVDSPVRSIRLMLFLMGLFAALCLAAVPVSIWALTRGETNVFYSDVLFPGILAAGFVVLLMTIAITVALFRALGLQDARHALGLPEGTVAALIALVLILLFGMVGIFVFLNGQEYRVVPGLTRDQVQRLDPAELVRVDCRTDSDCTVERVVRRDPGSSDVGKQLVTTVSTLVVAISAFYFGSTQFGRGQQALASAQGSTDPGGTRGESSAVNE